jgi:hypothetical protein
MQVTQAGHNELAPIVNYLIVDRWRRERSDWADVSDAFAFDHKRLFLSRGALRATEQFSA